MLHAMLCHAKHLADDCISRSPSCITGRFCPATQTSLVRHTCAHPHHYEHAESILPLHDGTFRQALNHQACHLAQQTALSSTTQASTCRARPKEKDRAQGRHCCCNACLLMLLRYTVASSSDKPPDRNMTPGIAGGIHLHQSLLMLNLMGKACRGVGRLLLPAEHTSHACHRMQCRNHMARTTQEMLQYCHF